jgi:hypothetical protein
MSATNAFETEILDLIFTGSGIADLADNDATSPATNLYVSLHTSDPGEAGVHNTNETAYTNYARVAVARTSGGWTVSGNLATNAGAVTFPACGVTGATITHFGIGPTSSGASVLLFKGALTTPLAVSAGITPAFAAGEIDVTAD